jgi:transcriptional regulator with XRE-family HTH domain
MKKAGLDRKTISTFERGKKKVEPETVEAIRNALAAAGVIFLEEKPGEYLPTVALRFGYVKQEPTEEDVKGEGREETEAEAKKRLLDHWESNPEGLAMVSEEGREELMQHLRGDCGGIEGDLFEAAAE